MATIIPFAEPVPAMPRVLLDHPEITRGRLPGEVNTPISPGAFWRHDARPSFDARLSAKRIAGLRDYLRGKGAERRGVETCCFEHGERQYTRGGT